MLNDRVLCSVPTCNYIYKLCLCLGGLHYLLIEIICSTLVIRVPTDGVFTDRWVSWIQLLTLICILICLLYYLLISKSVTSNHSRQILYATESVDYAQGSGHSKPLKLILET